MKWCVLVLVFAGLSRGDNTVNTKISNCPELNSQDEIDLDKIMGKWYVVEILEHRGDPLKKSTGTNSQVVNACPIVNLRSSQRNEYTAELHQILRLLWTEEAGNVEYTFQLKDIRRKGFWQITANQNGTMTQKSGYKQFRGTVHVMKAVASDMVLTFCSRYYDDQLYSLLLSRQHTMQKSDKRGVHNLLARRGLKPVSIRETCVNGEAGSKRCTLDLVSWTTIVGLISSSLLVRSWQ
ncbi:uncharacterized protein LOC109852163 [Pseudomyrmex gracilis]|uniref:uncharacterized protein LOC109852163 n=1 Tax=Pseudomyrmex gracilis TaxID=219809 RepID=UPI000995695D|nr:uncharacterized protein LOC109852163 [Pseudomyrmex gracilis]XP_020278642.1 uncharacterized protein LOC109852163 [Pseudomyrmex gracilis]